MPDGPRGPRERAAARAWWRWPRSPARRSCRSASRPVPPGGCTRGIASWCRCRSRGPRWCSARPPRCRATPTARRARIDLERALREVTERGRSAGGRVMYAAVHGGARRGGRPATRRWRCCAGVVTRRAAQPARAAGPARAIEPPAAAVRLDPRGLGGRGDRRRAAGRGAAAALARAAARRVDGDGDRRARGARALRGPRPPPLSSRSIFPAPSAGSSPRSSPAFFVCMETELWPNLLRTLAARGVPVDDRQRPALRSLVPSLPARARRHAAGAGRRDASSRMQSDEDARRVIALGAAPERVVVTGNLKHEPLPDPGRRRRSLASPARPGARPAGVDRRQHAPRRGGGGARGARGARRATRPDLALVIAPRHPERVGEVIGAGDGARLRPRSGAASCRAPRRIAATHRDRARHGRRAGPALLDRRRRVRGRQPRAVRRPQHARAGRCAASPCCSGPTRRTSARRRRCCSTAAAVVVVHDAGELGAELSRLLDDPVLRATPVRSRARGRRAHGTARSAAPSTSSRAICIRRRRRERAPAGCVAGLGARLHRRRRRRCWPRWPAAIAGCSARASGSTRAACSPRARSTARWSRSATSPSAAPARRRRSSWRCGRSPSSGIGPAWSAAATAGGAAACRSSPTPPRSGSMPRRRATSRSCWRAGCPACRWWWAPTATRRGDWRARASA